MPLVIKGSSSGQVTVDVPAAAGTNTLTFPAATGNVITNKTAGTIIQIVNFTTGASATGTTQMVGDDTIPQNDEGDEYMTLAVTPTNSSNKLIINVRANVIHTGTAGAHYGALFQDSTANALATAWAAKNATANNPTMLVIDHYMTAGTTSETTFKFRSGISVSGTTTFNGVTGSRFFGGSFASSITITEVAT
tara:strand:+ start:221 stop:799 length:579 start_codon:yes stop_codon:yes gene_type:complete